MTNILRALILASALADLLHGADRLSTPQPAPLNLETAIRNHIAQDRFQDATWGVQIESLDSGQVLFEHNADKLLKPASNAKLFTAALVLDRLGPERRLRTSVFARRTPSRGGTISGDLYIYGRGDFSFASRFHEGDYSVSLLPLIQAVKTAGVRRVRGGLVGDASYFHGPPHGSSWTVDDLQHAYGAEVSALTHEDNVVDLMLRPGSTVGMPCDIETRPETTFLTFVNHTLTADASDSRRVQLYRPPGGNVVFVDGQLPLRSTNWPGATPVANAPLWFVTQLNDQLRRHHVTVTQPPRTIDWLTPAADRPNYDKLVEITAVESPPMRELVRFMMKPSQNLYAQALFLQAGRHRQSTSTNTSDALPATEEFALAELNDFLVRAGIPTNSVRLDEGSGLSRLSLVTPRAIVRLLAFMDQHPHAEHFRASLPVAGVDGTLARRMNGTPAEGRVRAKTGSLAHVSTLSGYVATVTGERLIFSFILNHHQLPNPRSELDTLAVMLASFEAPFPGPVP